MTSKTNKSNKQTSNKAVNQTDVQPDVQPETVQPETVQPDVQPETDPRKKALAALLAAGFSQAEAESVLGKPKTGGKPEKFIELPPVVHGILKEFFSACQTRKMAGTGKTGKDGKETVAVKSRSFDVKAGNITLNAGDISGKFSEMFDSLKANTRRKTSFETGLNDKQIATAQTFVIEQFKTFIKAISDNLNAADTPADTPADVQAGE